MKLILTSIIIAIFYSASAQDTIRVSNTLSPRLKSYQDSLQLYNSWNNKYKSLNDSSSKNELENYGEYGYRIGFHKGFENGEIRAFYDKYLFNGQIISKDIIPLGCNVFYFRKTIRKKINKNWKENQNCNCGGYKGGGEETGYTESEVHIYNYSNTKPTQIVVFESPKPKPIVKVKKPAIIVQTGDTSKPVYNIGYSIPTLTLFHRASDSTPYEKPTFSVTDKQTKFYVAEDGKTLVPYIEKTIYDSSYHPIRVDHLDPQTQIIIK